MTRYLDVKATSTLIQQIGLPQAITELAAYIVDDYRRWPQFEKCPRTANHSPKGVIELMLASDRLLYSFKYVNGHPQNFTKNLPTVMAFGVLADVETGMPLLLSEMTLMTALRTAATSAAVAQKLARQGSRKMALIGCGAQSEFQAIAFKTMLGLSDVSVYDVDPQAIAKFQQNMSGVNDLTVTAASSVRAAVKGADIVTTATADKTKATILTADMIEPGMHINAIGGDCPGKTELHPDILRNARVFVEYETQTRIEGDIQQMPADFPVTELWKLFTEATGGRQSDQEVTVFDGVGFALEDFSTLRYLKDVSLQLKAGVSIDLIPSLPNPKDLYSLLQTINVPMPPFKAKVTVERKQ